MLTHLIGVIVGLSVGWSHAESDDLVARVLSKIDPQRMHADVTTLAGFGTRHTFSDPDSTTRGIGAARRWIKSEMEAASRAGGGRLRVTFEEFDQPPTARVPTPVKIVNVVGVLPGTMPEATTRRYYVVGHYDSRNASGRDGAGDAPGANDDASGTAVVIELARVLADARLDATIVFLATGGEEQGLLGAAYHAAQAAARKEDIRGVLNNDIVGDPTGPVGPDGKRLVDRGRVRVFSEGVPRNPNAQTLAEIRNLAAENDSPSRQLARYVHEIGERHQTDVQPMLVFRPDRFLRGGDHLAFNEQGFPAVRFTTVYENFDRQHQNVSQRDGKPYGDVPEFVDGEYLANVARLNAAVLINMANAPSAPPNARLLSRELTNDTTIRWDPSPDLDVAGYEVVWRETTDALWRHSKDVGKVTEVILPFSKDNVFIGVRAYDRDGYKSPVAFPSAERQ